jgi:hypothetical protein
MHSDEHRACIRGDIEPSCCRGHITNRCTWATASAARGSGSRARLQYEYGVLTESIRHVGASKSAQ